MLEGPAHARQAAGAGSPAARISPEERVRIERENRRLLERELSTQSLGFASRPYMADLQFSNFCNMSCTMCYDGENPPLRRMSPALLQRIEDEVAPALSIINPYGGSEPLVLTWDETLRMAQKCGVLLDVTTNIQFLDEKRFHELKGITQTLLLSMESHIPEVYAKIRLKADVKRVFANLPLIARLSREHGVECIVNVIFMTENAQELAGCLAVLALGGENEHVEHCFFEGQDTLLQVPEDLWRRLRPNMGYWWTVWGAPRAGGPALRAAEIRCLIRHAEIPRVAGSTLRYSDQGGKASRYLGGQDRPPPG